MFNCSKRLLLSKSLAKHTQPILVASSDAQRFVQQVFNPSGNLQDKVFLHADDHTDDPDSKQLSAQARAEVVNHIEVTLDTIRLVFDQPCDEYRRYARLLGPDALTIIEQEAVPQWMIPIKVENLISIGGGAIITLQRQRLVQALQQLDKPNTVSIQASTESEVEK